jgi:hypothetical protein
MFFIVSLKIRKNIFSFYTAPRYLGKGRARSMSLMTITSLPIAPTTILKISTKMRMALPFLLKAMKFLLSLEEIV